MISHEGIVFVIGSRFLQLFVELSLRNELDTEEPDLPSMAIQEHGKQYHDEEGGKHTSRDFHGQVQ